MFIWYVFLILLKKKNSFISFNTLMLFKHLQEGKVMKEMKKVDAVWEDLIHLSKSFFHPL